MVILSGVEESINPCSYRGWTKGETWFWSAIIWLESMGPAMRSGCAAKHKVEARRGNRNFKNRMKRSVWNRGWLRAIPLAYTAFLQSDQVLRKEGCMRR